MKYDAAIHGDHFDGFGSPVQAFNPQALRAAAELSAMPGPANDFVGGGPDDEVLIVDNPRQRRFSRLYNSAARIVRSKKAQDMAAGMLVSGLARWGIVGVGTAVGLTGLPIIGATAVGVAVARTAWNISRDYKKHAAENEESMSFWSFLGQNKKKYIGSLAMSTAFATLGATFMTYAMPAIEHWAAPVIERVMQSQTVNSLVTAFAGLFGKPEVPAPVTDNVLKDAVSKPGDAIVQNLAPVTSAPTISDKITDVVKDQNISVRWQAIAERAIDGNAQDQKDIASALLNGTHGFHKDAAQAAEIYRSAASAGNMQAKVDLAYMQFHGLGGIKADHESAIETLREHAQDNKYARSVLNHLTGHVTAAPKAVADALAEAAKPEIVPPAPSAAPVSALAAAPVQSIVPVAPGNGIPDGAQLGVIFKPNAEGVIEGIVEKAPAWLKDGMQIKVPVVEVQ